MPKKKSLKKCPNCGSKNLQAEKNSRKGRQLYICAECDHEFEIHSVDKNDQPVRKGEI